MNALTTSSRLEPPKVSRPRSDSLLDADSKTGTSSVPLGSYSSTVVASMSDGSWIPRGSRAIQPRPFHSSTVIVPEVVEPTSGGPSTRHHPGVRSTWRARA